MDEQADLDCTFLQLHLLEAHELGAARLHAQLRLGPCAVLLRRPIQRGVCPACAQQFGAVNHGGSTFLLSGFCSGSCSPFSGTHEFGNGDKVMESMIPETSWYASVASFLSRYVATVRSGLTSVT